MDHMQSELVELVLLAKGSSFRYRLMDNPFSVWSHARVSHIPPLSNLAAAFALLSLAFEVLLGNCSHFVVALVGDTAHCSGINSLGLL
jgi:hypothetical protein